MTIREIKSRKHMEYKQNRKDIYYFIVKYEKHKGEMPQVKIIAEELDLSPSAVQRHLRQLADDGLIEFSGGRFSQKIPVGKKERKMKLYDLYTLDGTFVDTLTRKEAVEMFSLSGWCFRTKIDFGESINDEYYLDDSEDDITVRKHKDKDMLVQFDLLTSKLRKILKVEEK